MKKIAIILSSIIFVFLIFFSIRENLSWGGRPNRKRN